MIRWLLHDVEANARQRRMSIIQKVMCASNSVMTIRDAKKRFFSHCQKQLVSYEYAYNSFSKLNESQQLAFSSPMNQRHNIIGNVH